MIESFDTTTHIELDPVIIVIFGITGDLSTRKLLPSLYELIKNDLLHEKTTIVGVSRKDINLDELLAVAREEIQSSDGHVSEGALATLAERIDVYKMNSTQAEEFPGLSQYLNTIEQQSGMCLRRIFYLSVPPQVAAPIIQHLGEQTLSGGCAHGVSSRLLMEKPFGFDSATAQDLIEITTKHFDEDQIFRIDHYLAKETVQNIVTFRFRNPIFEDIWNNQSIQSIEIVADEKLDIEGRANFYEQTGALRDLIQSHLMYVMSVVMMDRPSDLMDSHRIHESRLAFLQSVEPMSSDTIASRTVRGQYRGYIDEVENSSSTVETFVALTLYSSAEAWKDVPVIIRTGKALRAKQTRITICFKPKQGDHEHTNRLIFSIQPEEAITIELWVKKPGYERVMQTATMNFNYKQAFDANGHPNAYERVLVDAIRGDHTLFATSDEVMASWRVLQPVLDAWEAGGDDLEHYDKGSDGPSLNSLDGFNSMINPVTTSDIN